MLSATRSESGAAAIEYAVIAGLIALGIVGSLVGTRGSLSAVFGTVSNQLGSGSQGGVANPVAAASPNWSSKTIASSIAKTAASGQTYTAITFTDGSNAKVYPEYKGANTTYPAIVWMTDASNPLRTEYIQYPRSDGKDSQLYTYYGRTNYRSDGTKTDQYTVGGLAPDGTASGQYQTFDTAGNLATQTKVTPLVSSYSQQIADADYLRTLAP